MNGETLLDQFPTVEDWVSIQGGRPLVFGPDDIASEGVFYLIHDYGYATAKRPALEHAGLVVPTPSHQMLESVESPTGFSIIRHLAFRNVLMPAVMIARHHGLACEQKSYDAGRHNGYARITHEQVDRYVGMTEYRLGVLASGKQILRPKR